jgi:hypothetical protein
VAAIGVTDMDILFDTEKGRFSYRAAGLAVKEGRLLVQRMRGDQGLAIPGGHVAFGETGDGVVFYPPQLAGHLTEKGILHFVSNQLN